MTDKHLMDDNRSHDEAGDEFKREHGEESEIAIAAASGKGRKAIVQGTHYLLQRSNPPISATPSKMRRLLAEWESRDSDTARFGFRDRIIAGLKSLRTDCFCDGLSSLVLLEKDIVENVWFCRVV